jgi:hypothetical protein
VAKKRRKLIGIIERRKRRNVKKRRNINIAPQHAVAIWVLSQFYHFPPCSATKSCGESEVNGIIERRKRMEVMNRRNIAVAPRHVVAI